MRDPAYARMLYTWRDDTLWRISVEFAPTTRSRRLIQVLVTARNSRRNTGTGTSTSKYLSSTAARGDLRGTEFLWSAVLRGSHEPADACGRGREQSHLTDSGIGSSGSRTLRTLRMKFAEYPSI